MWDGRLEPRFLPRCLREPRPNCCDVQEAQILKQNTPAKAQGLNDKVIEKIIRRSWKVVGQKCGNVSRIIDDLRNDGGDAGRDRRDQHELDKKKGKIKVLRNDLTFTTRRCAYKDRQFP